MCPDAQLHSRSAPVVLALRMLGTQVHVYAPESLLRLCGFVLGWFAVPVNHVPADISFYIGSGPEGYRTVVEQNGGAKHYLFDTEERVFGFLYAHVLDQVTRRNPDLLCVHAAALARADRGLVLAAPSRHGKSTLSLALSARGFEFLSDEVAPIYRSSLELLPFPLAIGCRPGTREVLGGAACDRLDFESRSCFGKRLYDPSERIRRRARRVRAHTVFFVEPADESSRERRRFRLFLDPASEEAASALSDVDGVRSAHAEARGRSVVLELHHGAWVAPAVEAALRRERIMVTAVEDLDAPEPDFDAEPRLDRLTTSQGVLAMFRHLRGFGAIEDLSAATPGGFGALLMELAWKFRDVEFFRLTPGRLPRMLEAIEAAVGA